LTNFRATSAFLLIGKYNNKKRIFKSFKITEYLT